MSEEQQDLVGVFTENFEQLFEMARPIKASVKREAILFKHPLETGAKIADHRIIEPVEIEMLVHIWGEDYPNTYQNIKAAWLRGDALTVRTKVDTFANMVLSGIPHEEVPEIFDAVPMLMRFEEIFYSKYVYRQAVPRKSIDNSKVKRGEQSPKPTILHRVFF